MSLSPEAYQKILKEGLERVEKIKVRRDENGIVILPAVCWCCDQLTTDVALVNADDCVVCNGCIDVCAAALEGTLP